MSFTKKVTPEAYVYEARLPGLKKEDVMVEFLEGRILRIRVQGTTKEVITTPTGSRSSSSSVQFANEFTLPANAKDDVFEKNVKNGVVTVTIPKKRVQKKKQMMAIQNQVRNHNMRNPGVGMKLSGTSSSYNTHPQVSGEDYDAPEDVTKLMEEPEAEREDWRKQAIDALQKLSIVESLLEQFQNNCNCNYQPSVPIPHDNYDSQLDPYHKHMLYNNKMNPRSSRMPSSYHYDTRDDDTRDDSDDQDDGDYQHDGDDEDGGYYQHDGDYQSGSGYKYGRA